MLKFLDQAVHRRTLTTTNTAENSETMEEKFMPHLISFEGMDGCGKTTIIQILKVLLDDQGIKVRIGREPGGTAVGEALRAVLLNSDQVITARCELFCFEASRSEFSDKVIRPALESGEHFIADRLYDSTRAYQIGGRFNGDPRMREFVNQANAVAMNGIVPTKTFFLDISVETGRKRTGHKVADNFEKERDDFFERVRQEYLLIAQEEPERFIVINGEQLPEDVLEDVFVHLRPLLRID